MQQGSVRSSLCGGGHGCCHVEQRNERRMGGLGCAFAARHGLIFGTEDGAGTEHLEVTPERVPASAPGRACDDCLCGCGGRGRSVPSVQGSGARCHGGSRGFVLGLDEEHKAAFKQHEEDNDAHEQRGAFVADPAADQGHGHRQDRECQQRSA
jgi:hypothetical protein